MNNSVFALAIAQGDAIQAQLKLAALRRKYYTAVVIAAASSIGWFVCFIGEYYA
ncbi:hypothetical protein HMSP1_77 [Sinorhizobium phage HMSP1-Susan]|nr:hypothetical protein HMSP1_77 [Sinorhizobium phage HMSP1-Susan]